MFGKLFRKKPTPITLDANAPIQKEGFLTENFGIQIYDGSVAPFAKIGNAYPFEGSCTFTTTEDNQCSIKLSFYRGTDQLAQNCRFLGLYQLSGFKLAPAEEPLIRLFFRLKDNKIELWAMDENGRNDILITLIKNSNGELVQ